MIALSAVLTDKIIAHMWLPFPVPASLKGARPLLLDVWKEGRRKDEVRLLVEVIPLCFLQFFDTVGSVTRRISGPWNLCHLSSKVLFQNKWKKKTKMKPADPGSWCLSVIVTARRVLAYLSRVFVSARWRSVQRARRLWRSNDCHLASVW